MKGYSEPISFGSICFCCGETLIGKFHPIVFAFKCTIEAWTLKSKLARTSSCMYVGVINFIYFISLQLKHSLVSGLEGNLFIIDNTIGERRMDDDKWEQWNTIYSNWLWNVKSLLVNINRRLWIQCSLRGYHYRFPLGWAMSRHYNAKLQH